MTQKIFTGDDRARELGFKSYREFVTKFAARMNYTIEEGIADDMPLNAFVTGGRWVAQCECGDCYYVSPTDPLGFCYGGCGNAVQGGKLRPIVFPDNRAEIEAALLERELNCVQTAFDRLGTQHALHPNLFQPVGAPRNWDGETVEELRTEQEQAVMQQEVNNG